MSTKELIEECNKLLESSLEEHEKNLVKRMLDTILSYKLLIPISLKTDIKSMLVMTNRIKNDYDLLIIKYKENTTINEINTTIEEINNIETVTEL